jgi:hypothetical protein
MGNDLTGGCQCGAIRYSVSVEPRFSLICHCRQCQHLTGTGHAAQFAVSFASTVIEGTLSFYDLTADSGNAVRNGFCRDCGTPILKISAAMPDAFVIHAGSMDDPGKFKPDFVVFDHAKQPWDHVDDSLLRK